MKLSPGRFIFDVGAVLLLVGLIVGGVALRAAERDQAAVAELVANEVRRLELEVKYRAATEMENNNGRGWPTTIDPAWFTEELPPQNSLVSGGRPWIEIASPAQRDLLHPAVRQTLNDEVAGFWYNPYQGVVRARVPVLLRDEKALELYNLVNGSVLFSLFDESSTAPDHPMKLELPGTGDADSGDDSLVDGSGDPTQPRTDASPH